MERYSVRKPYTILVAVIAIIALGIVSVLNTVTDLLPSISVPYILVVTVYPGANPDQVETTVSKPMEDALGTITNVKNIISASSENYGITELEFTSDTDMDSALVKVSAAVNQVAASLPEGCGTPNLIQMSMDMVATMYVAVSHDGYDINTLSSYVRDTVVPTLERQEGVASVNTIGLVEKTLQVELNQRKIDDLNAKILAQTESELADAKSKLDAAQAQVDSAQDALEQQESSFGDTLSSQLMNQIRDPALSAADSLQQETENLLSSIRTLQQALNLLAETQSAASDAAESGADIAGNALSDPATFARQLDEILRALNDSNTELTDPSVSQLMGAITRLTEASTELQAILDSISNSNTGSSVDQQVSDVSSALSRLSQALQDTPEMLDSLEEAFSSLTQAQLDAAVGFSDAARQLADAQAQLKTAYTQYESAKASALANANADDLLTASQLAKLIYAQNFSMPAGYVDDADDNSWLLRVGDTYGSSEDISDALLCTLDGIGTIRVSDVADITLIDNSGDSYAKLNGQQGVVLCIYKTSTAGTNAVSRACNAALKDLSSADPESHSVNLVDQGSYITLIINDILKSILFGAVLAILVLFLFLRNWRPTLIVGISIPLSVLFTLVLMYFSGLTLNMITLSGLALGIGMLVDNSIVVMENIIRLRASGLSPTRAALQGTKQVVGAIVSSTLTTICVFLPMVFSTGLVRELLVPMGITITYCLTASLLVAVTVVPSSASALLRHYAVRENPKSPFNRVKQRYAIWLDWCLNHKAPTLLVAVALLAFCIAAVFRTGVTVLPEMVGNSIQVQVQTNDGLTKEESHAQADEVLAVIQSVDGVENAGMMDAGSAMSVASSISVETDQYGTYVCYVTAAENASGKEIKQICNDINTAAESLPCEVKASTNVMSDYSTMIASGLTIHVYGPDTDSIQEAATQIAELVRQSPGFEDVSDGEEDAQRTLHLIIDKDKAMSYGLTVAQIYAQIAERLQTDVTSTTLRIDGENIDVVIRANSGSIVTRENLMDMEFSSTSLMSASSSDALNSSSTSDSALTGSLADTSTAAGSDSETQTHKLSEFATLEETSSPRTLLRNNLRQYMDVTATTKEGYNTDLLTRDLEPQLEALADTLPEGCSYEISGEFSQVQDMLHQMLLMIALAVLLIYLVMVAQFQSLLSPFIILLTLPLAFTGGVLALLISGEQITALALMGFLILLGTIVNNGIVFVDYTNQLRVGGMSRHDALMAAGQTRMRPILMTALTTILALLQLMLGSGMGSQLGRGMAIVMTGGLLYGTLMTLFIIPVMYDILCKKPPLHVDVDSDMEEVADDAAAFLASQKDSENPASATSPESGSSFESPDPPDPSSSM
jgi:multidrug efflux pump subunit AcrB